MVMTKGIEGTALLDSGCKASFLSAFFKRLRTRRHVVGEQASTWSTYTSAGRHSRNVDRVRCRPYINNTYTPRSFGRYDGSLV
jgi:hypothetical protein